MGEELPTQCATKTGAGGFPVAVGCRGTVELTRRGSVEASASGIKSPEGLPFGAGLGWREDQRRGLGTAQVPNQEKAAEPLRSSRSRVSGRSIIVRLHGGKQAGLGG